MKFHSVWSEIKKEYSNLNNDIKRDIVVIGGGIAGFLTAFRLAECGNQVTLIESDRLFSGTTGKTTAKITCNQGNIYTDLSLRYGTSVALLYYRAQLDGMSEFAELVQRYKIDCDWEETDSYIFSYKNSYRIEQTCKILQSWGADCEVIFNNSPFHSVCSLKMSRQYLFDPLKFLNALPINFEIYEHTRAINIDVKNKIIYTDGGKIKAEKIVVATHFPIINSHGGYFMKLRQSMSYTIAVDKRLTEAMYLNEKEDGLSVRPYIGGTILGGGDHRTGRMGKNGHFKQLENYVKRVFGINGADVITHRWCAQDVMTWDGMPMAGRYVGNLDDIYIITGFNKWGMSNSMVCASVLRDVILGKENIYAKIFSPQRRIKKSFGAFISNAFTNVKGIFFGYFRITMKTVADIPAGRGMIAFYNGKKRAVYRDFDNKLYVIGRMCPHMHCELQWNADTKTWDCPCHGSRFDIYGNILSEPSVKKCKLEKD